MAGEDRLDELVAFLSRLTGETLSAEQPVVIRSVHRAALSAWARRQNLPIAFGVLAGGGPVRLRDLLAGGAAITAPGPVLVQAAGSAAVVGGGGGVFSVGIDIEEVGTLPVADDYREHAFYTDNFTTTEIAYCIRQADARASFCGTWAAKEAIFKAGLAHAPSGQFKTIEIARDALGRPGFAGAQLSISHTPTTAVAVCVAFAPAPPAAVPPAVVPVPLQTEAPARQSSRLSLGVGVAAGVVLVAAGSAVSLALHLWY